MLKSFPISKIDEIKGDVTRSLLNAGYCREYLTYNKKQLVDGLPLMATVPHSNSSKKLSGDLMYICLTLTSMSSWRIRHSKDTRVQFCFSSISILESVAYSTSKLSAVLVEYGS